MNDASEFAAAMEHGWQADGAGKWLARRRGDATLIGRGGCSLAMVEGRRQVEIGWAVKEQYWGRGYATEIGRAGLAFAFETLQVERVVAFTEIHNRRSRAVMERLGMKHVHDFTHPGLVEGSEGIHDDALFVLYEIGNPGSAAASASVTGTGGDPVAAARDSVGERSTPITRARPQMRGGAHDDLRIVGSGGPRWAVSRFARRAGVVTPVDITRRRELASQLLDGYVHGPAAATEATARALAKVPAAESVVLVEGISDQIAVETLAIRRGRDLDAEGVVVLPAGGAHAIARYLSRFGPSGAGLRLSGLCDLAEESVIRRGLARSGLGAPQTGDDMERLDFYVCVEDLEDELIRAIGPARVESLIDSQGDLGSFRSLQRQPQWRGQPVAAQLRRFLGSGGTRKLRYARLLTGSLDLDRLPHPLDGATRVRA